MPNIFSLIAIYTTETMACDQNSVPFVLLLNKNIT